SLGNSISSLKQREKLYLLAIGYFRKIQVGATILACQALNLGRTRLEIEADVGSVDLRSHCSYFYEFGCKLALLGCQVSTYTLPAEDVVVVDEDAASRIQRLTKVLNADTTGLQMLTKMKWENMQTLKLVYVACRHPADCRTLFM
ncbi:hypothetical protein LINPERHAP1_LOCUS12910, partial [Linum perenne]